VTERNTDSGLCKNIILRSEVESSKTEIERDYQHKNMQRREVQCPKVDLFLIIDTEYHLQWHAYL
jgi:hypothetical protein